MKEKLKELELQLNYVCYEAEMITKLQKVWKAYFELQEEFEKLNMPVVSNSEASVCDNCHKQLNIDDNFVGYCKDCETPIKQTDC